MPTLELLWYETLTANPASERHEAPGNSTERPPIGRGVGRDPVTRAEPSWPRPQDAQRLISGCLTIRTIMTSSPSFQFTGVATLYWSVSCRLSITRRISWKLRPVDGG